MATPPSVDVVIVASAIVSVTPTALATAISTLQAAVAASREHVVGAIAAAGATATAHPRPPAGPPFVTADASAPTGPAVGAAGSLVAAAAGGAPAGTVAGHPLAGLLFLAAGASAPAGPAAGAVGPLDAATTVGAPAGTSASAPAWLSFDLSMGGALYWLTLDTFFVAPQYGFLVQPAWPSSLDPYMGVALY
jgi:hypothetical protein